VELCLAGAAGGAPRVGQPGWACRPTPASPNTPPWRELGVRDARGLRSWVIFFLFFIFTFIHSLLYIARTA